MKNKGYAKFWGANRSFSVTWSAACKLLGIKESFYMWKEFNSHRIFVVHKYGRRDVMWKRSIRCIMGDLQEAYTLFCPVNRSLLIIFSFVSIILNLVTVLFYIYVALIVLMKVSGIRQYRNKGKTGPSYLSQRHLRLLLRTWEKPGQ